MKFVKLTQEQLDIKIEALKRIASGCSANDLDDDYTINFIDDGRKSADSFAFAVGCNILEIRRKPKTIRIGEFDVPEPVSCELSIGTLYFIPRLTSIDKISERLWSGTIGDSVSLENGIVHLKPKAAEIHANALISLTKKGD